MAKYKMVNPVTGDRIEFKKGLSFTALFFTGFVAVARTAVIDKEDKYKTSKFGGMLAALSLMSIGFANLIYLFTFNKMFKNHLEKNGFRLEENVKSVI